MKYSPKSHPDKLLIDHKKGILSIAEVNDLLLIATSFHDVGKMNDNFQKKINNKKFSGYSNHAYISAYYLINAFINNEKTILKRFSFINVDNFETILIILVNVVIGHHGCLRNIEKLFDNDEEWDKMISYLKTIKMTYHVNRFFKQHSDLLGCKLIFKDNIEKSEEYKNFGRIRENIKYWKDNALNYYLETLMTYAELINGDRRDASGNKLSYRNKTNQRYAYSLENNLEWIFNNFRSNTPLNKARNDIRKIAVNTLINHLKYTKNRTFTLTAPTGCGKTFMMLQLAVEILKHFNYQHDIIYSLPYLSIIDQTTKILNNDVRIETLNYTSASDTSRKLQSMIENENNVKELVEYAFSENCFDHPFIITTFNQLFETFLNNSTSKLLKLKNFKKRIFLIDEYQAVSPSQYYALVAILDDFCKKYDCYAIISTATMPNFGVDFNAVKHKKVKELFKTKLYPKELLPSNIFEKDVFNRYIINFMGEVNETSLFNMINNSKYSTLLIVNTIRTSQTMYQLFENTNNFDKIYSLNAHISPHDRQILLNEIKNNLNNNIKILVVSTQVIEAGVDISFPSVYRDAAPPPSVKQAFGRGNRNKEFEIINTYLFLFKNSINKQYDCDMVYHNTMTNSFKNDIKNKISPLTEKEFHKRCEKYFVGQTINNEVGYINNTLNIIEDILNGNFKNIGKYRLIQGDPDTHTIFVGNNEDLWKSYVEAYNNINLAIDYSERDKANIEFKRIRGIILQNSINVRQKDFNTINVEDESIFDVYKLKDNHRYNSRIGFIEI